MSRRLGQKNGRQFDYFGAAGSDKYDWVELAGGDWLMKNLHDAWAEALVMELRKRPALKMLLGLALTELKQKIREILGRGKKVESKWPKTQFVE